MSDDADLLFEQGQNQTAAHEPRIDQQAHVLDLSLDRVHQLPRHPKLAALSRFFEQPGADRDRQRRTEPDANHWSQRDPALAVQERRPIGLVAVIVLDADPRPGLRAARNQRIVDDHIHQLCREHPQHQLQQADRQFRDRDVRPLDQLVIGGSVRLSTNSPDGAGDPGFRVEHATDQELDKGSAGARRHRRQEKGNPFREQQENVGNFWVKILGLIRL